MEGRWEELDGIYDTLLEADPDSASARSGKAEELIHNGAYREAREMVLDLLEYSPQDERLMKDLTDANVFMIEELEPLWKAAGQLDQDGWMDLGWCYYQNMRFDDALAVLDSRHPDEEHLLDYHNLKGRVYLTMDKNEQALVHLHAVAGGDPQAETGRNQEDSSGGWQGWGMPITPSVPPEGGDSASPENDGRDTFSEEEKYKKLFPEAAGYEDAFAKAMEYFDKAIAAETEESQIVSYYHTVADIWRQQKRIREGSRRLRSDPHAQSGILSGGPSAAGGLPASGHVSAGGGRLPEGGTHVSVLWKALRHTDKNVLSCSGSMRKSGRY